MVITQRHWASHLIKTFCPVIVFMFSFGEAVFANDAEALRIETDVFADRDDIPIARSLILNQITQKHSMAKLFFTTQLENEFC